MEKKMKRKLLKFSIPLESWMDKKNLTLLELFMVIQVEKREALE